MCMMYDVGDGLVECYGYWIQSQTKNHRMLVCAWDERYTHAHTHTLFEEEEDIQNPHTRQEFDVFVRLDLPPQIPNLHVCDHRILNRNSYFI